MIQHTHNIGEPEGAPLVLYDGVCALCHWAVRFIVDRDLPGAFRFAPLQSELGRQWMTREGLSVNDLDTVVLVQEGRAYVRSDAAFRILAQLETRWRILAVFRHLPSFITDACYRLVASTRYRVFGRYDSCPLPPAHLRHRFLSDPPDPPERRESL